MLGSQFIRFLRLPAQRAAEEMLEFPYLMKGISHTCCSPSFGSMLLLLQPFFYIAICGRYKPKESRDLQPGLGGGLEERFRTHWQWRFATIKKRAWALRSSKELVCLPALFLHDLYAQRSVRMHIWHEPLFHAPKAVCSTCLVVLWMDKENLM